MLCLNRGLSILAVAALFAGCAGLAAAPSATLIPPPATTEPTVVEVPTANVQALPAATIDIASYKVKNFQFSSKALEGNLLGDPATRKTYIYLPPGYETSTQRYPVVYVMSWGNGKSSNNAYGVSVTMNELLQSGEAQEMILVYPDGSNQLLASLFKTSPTVGDYETYLTQEMVDYIDSNYRTLASRDSRGITGCSNGGEISMRIALRYPDVFSVVAASGGAYSCEPAGNASLQEELGRMTTLPEDLSALGNWSLNYPMATGFLEEAAGASSNPDNPPFFLDMPFRIVGDHAEAVPEVFARIEEGDSLHEAQRYVDQPIRLNGLLILHALQDPYNPTDLVRSSEAKFTDLGIDHEYVEVDAGHCSFDWDGASLKFMSDHLVGEAPAQN